MKSIEARIGTVEKRSTAMLRRAAALAQSKEVWMRSKTIARLAAGLTSMSCTCDSDCGSPYVCEEVSSRESR